MTTGVILCMVSVGIFVKMVFLRLFGPPKMRIICFLLFLVFVVASCGGNGTPTGNQPDEATISRVNPFIGTANDGNTYPGAVTPWGMVSVSPHNVMSTPESYITDDPFAPSGYIHGLPTIYGFGLTHISGAGCPDLGAPVIAMTTGDIQPGFISYGSTYRNESASPGYYAVELTDHGIRVEATASTRAGVLRLHFPETAAFGNVLVDVGENISWGSGKGEVRIVSSAEVEGYSETGRFCFEYNQQRIFFSARFSRPASKMGTWIEDAVSTNTEAAGKAGAWFSFDNPHASPIEVQVGISYVSIENARENLGTEIGDAGFDTVRAAAEVAWEDVLSRIIVTGGTEEEREIFYTALYHSLLNPSVFSDANGEYPLMENDGIGVAEGYTRYTIFSMWDSYRTVHPLLTLVYPETQIDMVRSICGMAEESGEVPMWELAGNEVNVMVGDPALAVVAETYLKGLRDFPVEDVYAVMRDGALNVNVNEGPLHRVGGSSYLELGYVPMEEAETVWGPVSTTLEYAYADWALAQLAKALGHGEDAERLEKSALAYRTLFDSGMGLLRPKLADGSWLDPFDPDAIKGSSPFGKSSGGPGYVEGTAWHYAFFAPHDIDGLTSLHGGSDSFVNSLQAVFDEGRFVMWNEPDMAYPYLFTYFTGESWRTQQEVRRAMETYFGTGPAGLPGNDDAGALSAWYVFSALGFYPDCPASSRYSIGSPLFDRAEIRLSPRFYPGEKIVVAVHQTTDRSPYVDTVLWNSDNLTESEISHTELIAGGMLEFTMTDTRK